VESPFEFKILARLDHVLCTLVGRALSRVTFRRRRARRES
jgi:hypothetical protein